MNERNNAYLQLYHKSTFKVIWYHHQSNISNNNFFIRNNLTQCGLVTPLATQNWVNIVSGNGLLPDGTKTLSVQMLTYHQLDSVAFTWALFHKKKNVLKIYIRKLSLKNKLVKLLPHLLGTDELNHFQPVGSNARSTMA